MRWWFLVALLGCSAHHATAPAWPKLHEAEKDGGESLAPHAAHAGSVAAVEKSGDDDAKPAAATAGPAAPAASKDAASPTGTAPTMIQEDVPVTTEDIIIEIDD